MPHNLSEDKSFSSQHELLHCNGSAEKTEILSPDESCSETFQNGILYNDNCEPLDHSPSEKNALHSENGTCEIGFVPSESEESLCGWGAFTPNCLQVFNTSKGVLLFLSVASFLQGMIVNGFINTVVTSIERQFNLTSYYAGLIASSYDIAACVCLIFVSYFGGHGHKPRWLGFGVLIMALGSFVFALPHFISSRYEVTLTEETGVCHSNATSSGNERISSLSHYRFIFMLGQFLHGVGATPLYTLGVTFLDESVKSNYSPVYIATFYTMSIIGPAAGYLLGGFFLTIFTEIGQKTHLTPDNPLWVGAWWIGFLGTSAAAFLTSIPILGYPRKLPGSQRYMEMRVSEAHQMKGNKTTLEPDFGKTIKDMPRSVLLLLKNPTFVFLCLSGATEAMLIAGMSTFGPKFMESQFSLSASEAATLFGYLVVPAGGGGTFLGGFIVKKMKLRCSGIIRFCLICIVCSLSSIFIFLIHCPNLPIAGVSTSYNNSITLDTSINLTASCNVECHCKQEIYHPVCGANGIMYFSACHAGCQGTNVSLTAAGSKVHHDCGCIFENFTVTAGHAVSGKCPSQCQHKAIFLTFVFTIIFFTFLCTIPALTATLRCVPDCQRSFALGIQWIVVRTLGSIPGPIAFGSLIDLSCLLWQNSNGVRGSCLIYQNLDMSRYTLAAGLIYKALGAMFFLLAYLLYRPPPDSPETNSVLDPGGKALPLPEEW
ncbi:solute carrier organic anion transporter family member 4A1 isoform X2 [Protopterus annectens]|uniref:solute carrier organic anion transporter family member 4A1 isoform X2 n=1 Tax=Protopterus annectens TaxID=7888 RepID=UPI001CFAAE84|nr:solute carrier organic anion transporter family member 4A1 isoform X2 [Protopterus annectens]